jgi:hypothetical protein
VNFKHGTLAARGGVIRDVRRLAEARFRFVEPHWPAHLFRDIQNSTGTIK